MGWQRFHGDVLLGMAGRVEWDFSKEDGKQENPSKRISGLDDEGDLQGCAGAQEIEGHRGRK